PQISKKGYIEVRVNNKIREILPGMKLDRYKTHDIELVIDKLKLNDKISDERLLSSIDMAMQQGDNVMMVLDYDTNEARFYSRNLMCPTTGISYPSPEPNTFSFNSPKGMCPDCNGLGHLYEVNEVKIFPDKKLSISAGGIAPLGVYKNSWAFKQIEIIAQRYNFKLTDPISNIPDEAIGILLHGGKESFEVDSKALGVKRSYKID